LGKHEVSSVKNSANPYIEGFIVIRMQSFKDEKGIYCYLY